jgi:hypothetical protein
MFSSIFMIYLILRLHAFTISDQDESILLARTALDVLSCAAPVLIPRLAFNVMSENMLFLSLRAMMTDFLTLTALAVWCFAGFLLSLKWLHAGAHESVTIGKWMIWIWFGLDGTGIGESGDFHWLLGPMLMVLFAFLGNTLFLTVLVSMLTNTFSGVVSNAVQEIQFRRAVLTFEGVKSDAIFAYMPPFNILALLILLPLKRVLSERAFHKVNVAAVRTINLPTLLFVAWYERRTLWMSNTHRWRSTRKIDWKNPSGPKASPVQSWSMSSFSVHGDLHAVFDIDPPQELLDKIEEDDDLDHSDTMGILSNTKLKNQFASLTEERRESQASAASRKVSGNKKEKKKRRRETRADVSPKQTLADRKLNEHFRDSDDAGDEADHPTGYRKAKKSERMDSIIDFGGGQDARVLEALARLHQIESSMERMEAMLSQIAGGDASSENSEAKEELEQEMRTHSMQ